MISLQNSILSGNFRIEWQFCGYMHYVRLTINHCKLFVAQGAINNVQGLWRRGGL